MAILAPAVDLRDVTKSYDEGGRVRVVLDRITATLLQGEVTVVVGRSGSGKSTFLNLIGGIDVPSSGAVWVGGARIERLARENGPCSAAGASVSCFSPSTWYLP